MKERGERLMVGPDLELQAAVENFEMHWRKCTPLTDVRFREGLPIVTREELQEKKAVLQQPFLKKRP